MPVLPQIPVGSWRMVHSIVSETRRGNPIPNRQEFLLTPAEIANPDQFKIEFPEREGFRHRSPHNPIYNCHGMTFAARRTWIHASETVRAIVADDCYERVAERDVLPGDVVLYVSDKGDVEHSGVVMMTEGLVSPVICSKWGRYGEVVHPVNRSPYTSTAVFEYYRVKR